MKFFVQAYASRGYIAVAVDSRYHGERASNKTTYLDVINNALPQQHKSERVLIPSYLLTYVMEMWPQN